MIAEVQLLRAPQGVRRRLTFSARAASRLTR